MIVAKNTDLKHKNENHVKKNNAILHVCPEILHNPRGGGAYTTHPPALLFLFLCP